MGSVYRGRVHYQLCHFAADQLQSRAHGGVYLRPKVREMADFTLKSAMVRLFALATTMNTIADRNVSTGNSADIMRDLSSEWVDRIHLDTMSPKKYSEILRLRYSQDTPDRRRDHRA